MEKKRQRQEGITLVALIITIIVLVILAAVTIYATTQMNIVDKAMGAVEEYQKAQIEETIYQGITDLTIENLQNGKLTLEQTLIGLQEKGILESIDLSEEIGIIQGNVVSFGYDEKGNIIILEISRDGETRVLVAMEPKSYTKEKVELQFSTSAEEVTITNIELPSGMTKNAEGKYEVVKNGTYLVKFTLSDGKGIEKKIIIKTIDNLKPKDFEITATENEEGILINAKTEDAEATNESACAGMDRYEYYYKLSTEEEYQKLAEGNLIKAKASKKYDIYVIAYDKVGNAKQSNTIQVTRTLRIMEDVEYTFTKLDKGNTDAPNILMLYTGGSWEDSWAYMKITQNLHDYSQVLITFSYTPGYTYGYGLYTKDGSRIINGGSDAAAPESVERQTKVFDIPADCDPHRLWFRAGSMSAYFYLHELKLIK